MDKFDQIWGSLVVIVPIVIMLVSAVIQATPTQRDDAWWAKVSAIIGRIFSVRTHQDPATGKASWKLPVVQGVNKEEK